MAGASDSLMLGAQIIQGAGNIITIGPGIAFLNGGNRLAWAAALSVTLPASPVSTWYNLFLYQNGSGVPAVEAVTTAADAPYQGTARAKVGDTSRRFAGSIYVNASGAVAPFVHGTPGLAGNLIEYTPPTSLPSSVNMLLSAGTSQSAVTVDASVSAPPNCKRLRAQIDNSAGLTAYFGNPTDTPALSATSYSRKVRGGNSPVIDLIINDSRQFSYVYGAGITLGGSLEFRVIGYFFDR